MKKKRKIHDCECPICRQEGDHRDKKLHRQMNVFLSRLDEQQRRWYVAIESIRLGHGGEVLMSQISGMDEKTIRQGSAEMAEELEGRPPLGNPKRSTDHCST